MKYGITLMKRERWVNVVLEEDIRFEIKMFQVLIEVEALWHI